MKYVCNCGAEADGNWALWRNRGKFSDTEDQYVRVWVKDRRIVGTTLEMGQPGLCPVCIKAELDKFWGEYKLRKAAEKEAKRKDREANPPWWKKLLR